MMDADELARLREIATKATPGPWSWYTPDKGYLADYVITEHPDFQPDKKRPFRHLIAETECKDSTRSANSAHIAAFDPPTVLALLDDLENAQNRLYEASAYVEMAARYREERDASRALLRDANGVVEGLLREWDRFARYFLGDA